MRSTEAHLPRPRATAFFVPPAIHSPIRSLQLDRIHYIEPPLDLHASRENSASRAFWDSSGMPSYKRPPLHHDKFCTLH